MDVPEPLAGCPLGRPMGFIDVFLFPLGQGWKGKIMKRQLDEKLLFYIGIITVLTGLGQWLFPEQMLKFIVAGNNPLEAHLFATVGMFMVVVGGLLAQGLRTGTPQPLIAFWVMVQKLGAAVMVGLAVMNGLFVTLALGVAAFDAASGLLAAYYWWRTR